jgi:hypothetical protein
VGKERNELAAQRIDAVASPCADRMKRVEVAEPRRCLHLRRDVRALQAVDLVQRNHDRNAEPEDASGNEAITGTDALTRREDEQDGVDILEGGLDRTLHVLGERVERPLEARQVGEDELVVLALVVLAVRDSKDAAARRLRLVRDNRDLAAGKGVHERRLTDVRAAGNRDEAGSQAGRSQVSGSRSAAEWVTSSPAEFRNVTSPIRNSYSHCRQPPQGEAVMPIASKSPGL